MGAVALASLDRGTARAATRALRDTLRTLDESGARVKRHPALLVMVRVRSPVLSHYMPHLFTNRPRAARHYGDADEIDLGQIWETKNSLLYELGGVLFIMGSVLFFPRFEAWKDIGA